jgi:putative hydrolase of the HAD superfamily
MHRRLEGIVLDVGGVFLIPDGQQLGRRLELAQIPFVPTFDHAHYLAVAAYDNAKATGDSADHWGAYVSAYIRGLQVPAPDHRRAFGQLRPLWSAPASDLWSSVVADSVADLLALSQRGLPLGIVSNSDGTVEMQLREHNICQVGVGPGVPVLAIVDSAVVGVSKPDPAIFTYALETMGLDPEAVGYIGDSVANDVAGAAGAGLMPFHIDPFDMCRDASHEHLSRVAEILSWV